MNDTSEDRKTLFVTGASRGIGHATARTFLDRGRRIITCLREDTPPECGRDPYWTCHIPTNLGDADSLGNFIEAANEELGDGPLHGLINNAVMSPKTPYKECLECLKG